MSQQHRQPRKKQAREVRMVEETAPPVMASTDEPIGDQNGYLAVGLAVAVVAIVAMMVWMVVLAAT